MHPFLTTPYTRSLKKYVLGSHTTTHTVAGINPRFHTQAYSEEFTQLQGFDARRLDDDQYFLEQLRRFAFFLPQEVAPISYEQATEQQTVLSKALACQALVATNPLSPLTGEQRAAVLAYWDQMAATLEKLAVQTLTPITSLSNDTQARVHNGQTVTHNGKDVIYQGQPSWQRTYQQDFAYQQEVEVSELSALALRRLHLFWGKEQTSSLAALQGKYTLAQINAAVEQQLALQLIAQDPSLDADAWCLVVKDTSYLVPDWQQRLEVLLQLLAVTKEIENNQQLQALAQEVSNHSLATSQGRQALKAYRQAYVEQLQHLYPQLPEQEIFSALAYYPEETWLACLDRLQRTDLVFLDNAFAQVTVDSYQAMAKELLRSEPFGNEQQVTKANVSSVTHTKQEATQGLAYLPAQSIVVNLTQSSLAYPQGKGEDVYQALHFLTATNTSCQQAFLVRKQALFTHKIAASTPTTQAYGSYLAAHQAETKLEKLAAAMHNHGLVASYPLQNMADLAASFSNFTHTTDRVIANLQPSLVWQQATTPTQAQALTKLSQELPAYNYSGNYLSQGYDYLATIPHFVVSNQPHTSLPLDAFNQMQPVEVASFMLQRVGLAAYAETQEEQVARQGYSLGNFYRQAHTINFRPLNLLVNPTSERAILEGQFLTLENLQALSQEITANQQILEHDYILLATAQTRFRGNWYHDLNQQLLAIVNQAEPLPALIALGCDELVVAQVGSVNANLEQAANLKVDLTKLNAFLVQKAQLVSLIAEQAAQGEVAAYALVGIVHPSQATPNQAASQTAELATSQATEQVIVQAAAKDSTQDVTSASHSLTSLLEKQAQVSWQMRELILSAEQFNALAQALQLTPEQLTTAVSRKEELPQVIGSQAIAVTSTAKAKGKATSKAKSKTQATLPLYSYRFNAEQLIALLQQVQA